MTKGFPHALHDAGLPIVVPEDRWCSVEAVKRKFFGHYEGIPIEDLLAEYDERIVIFRQFNRHGEVRILEEGKRTWGELRTRIGETRFKEELIMTLALALHATFSILASPRSESQNVAEIRKKVVLGAKGTLSQES